MTCCVRFAKLLTDFVDKLLMNYNKTQGMKMIKYQGSINDQKALKQYLEDTKAFINYLRVHYAL